ncbi:hypothetical protein OIO90_001809 [Microbotryomycetes sp. JL221]|nr:hypothetical protein OIO90_001809 [Microbotryomycetes sp. JL221]
MFASPPEFSSVHPQSRTYQQGSTETSTAITTDGDGRLQQQQHQFDTDFGRGGGGVGSNDSTMLASFLQQQQLQQQQNHLQQSHQRHRRQHQQNHFNQQLQASLGGFNAEDDSFDDAAQYMTATGALSGALTGSGPNSSASSHWSPSSSSPAAADHSRSATTSSSAGLSPPFGIMTDSQTKTPFSAYAQPQTLFDESFLVAPHATQRRHSLDVDQQFLSPAAAYSSSQQLSNAILAGFDPTGATTGDQASNSLFSSTSLSPDGSFNYLANATMAPSPSTTILSSYNNTPYLSSHPFGSSGFEQSAGDTVAPQALASSTSFGHDATQSLSTPSTSISNQIMLDRTIEPTNNKKRKTSASHFQRNKASDPSMLAATYPSQFIPSYVSAPSNCAPTDAVNYPAVGLIASAGMPRTQHMFSFAPSASKTTAGDDDAVEGGSSSSGNGDQGGKKASQSKGKKADNDDNHNAVERRYRNNINNSLAALRDAIPALQHLKPLPSMPQSRRKASQFSIPSAATAATPQGLVDGVPAAKTLSKGSILSKAVEYISYLQSARRDREEDIQLFKQVVMETVAGGEALVNMFEERRKEKDVERSARRRDEMEEDGDDLDEEEEEEEPPAKPQPAKKAKTSVAATAKSSRASQSTKAQQAPSRSVHQKRPHGAEASSRSANAGSGAVQLDALAQLRQHLANSGNALPPHLEQIMQQALIHPTGTFPLSPASSTEEATSVSPRYVSTAYPSHAIMPQRTLLATFMGLSFAGGLGYDLRSSAGAASGGEDFGARVWATRLVRKDAVHPVGFVGPAILSGLACLGAVSVVILILSLLVPTVLGSGRSRVPSTTAPRQRSEGDTMQSRSIYRQRRRAQALASLAQLKNLPSTGKHTYGSERLSALKARRELLKLVGAPSYGLLPALLKEGLATLLRNITTIRVGSFSHWSESERTEAAVAWVRIAEIESTVGADDVNYLARCYTFLRLFNLSHSKHWPDSTPNTILPAVNAVLAVHLLSLGQPLWALALWSKATRQARKPKSALDVRAHAWTDAALSVDFATVKALFSNQVRDNLSSHVDNQPATPSTTVPLLQISEIQCAAALREAWSKIFVSVVQTTCLPFAPSTASSNSFSTLADSQFLGETVNNVLEATVPGSTVHALALMTKSLCQVYLESQTDRGVALAKTIEFDRRDDGPTSRLACAVPFVKLVLGTRGYVLMEAGDVVDGQDLAKSVDRDGTENAALATLHEADILAQATLAWLLIRHQTLRTEFQMTKETEVEEHSAVEGGKSRIVMKADPTLHRDTIAVRRLLSHKVFHDAHLNKFCMTTTMSAQVGDGSTPSTPRQGAVDLDSIGGIERLDLEGALECCLDALTTVARSAAGLRADDDSGVECD